MPTSRSNKPATVWYSHGGGRFGNQMLRFAHLIAWVEEHRGEVELINLAVWPYMNLVAAHDISPAGIYPPRRSWLDSFARFVGLLPEKVGRGAFTMLRRKLLDAAGERFRGKPIVRVLDDGAGLDLGGAAFFDSVNATGGAWLIGWRIASWPLIRKHGDAIRRHLAVRETLAKPGHQLVDEVRRDADMVVGVLCRQTDYRVFFNGRYFIEQPLMARKLKSIEALHPGKRITFVVTGDEPIDPAHFEGLRIRIATGSQGMGGHFVESIAALSRCDLVVGAPSTFAAWAAFLGKKPYLALLPEREPELGHIFHDALVDAAASPDCVNTVI